MDVKEFLSSSDILVDVRASDKTQLLQELARRAAASLNLAAEQISAEILKREELGSTGTGGGVAIPHARIQGLKRTFGILVRLKKPIDFQAVDSKPVDLVFLLLLSAESAGVQLNAHRIGCQEVERCCMFAQSPFCGRHCRSLRCDDCIARENCTADESILAQPAMPLPEKFNIVIKYSPRTYNQVNVPRKSAGGPRFTIYWTWSYPWEPNRDVTELDNRFSRIT